MRLRHQIPKIIFSRKGVAFEQIVSAEDDIIFRLKYYIRRRALRRREAACDLSSSKQQ